MCALEPFNLTSNVYNTGLLYHSYKNIFKIVFVPYTTKKYSNSYFCTYCKNELINSPNYVLSVMIPQCYYANSKTFSTFCYNYYKRSQQICQVIMSAPYCQLEFQLGFNLAPVEDWRTLQAMS